MYRFNEIQIHLRNKVRQFAAESLEPTLEKTLDKGPLLKTLAKMGYLGMMVPQELGGSGMDMVSSQIVIKEIARSNAGLAQMLSGINFVFCGPLAWFGSPEQREKYLKPCLSGEKTGTLAHSEEGGTSIQQILTTAYPEGKGYMLNGKKSMITNAGYADFALVFAKSDPHADGYRGYSTFLADLKNTKGIRVSGNQLTMGLDILELGILDFDRAHLEPAQLLGEAGKGFSVILKNIEYMNASNAAVALGVAERAYEEVLSFVKKRKVNAQYLCELQSVQFKLADLKAALSTMELLVFYSASLFDQKDKSYGLHSFTTKMRVTEEAKQVCDQALQLFGGNGYMNGVLVERLYRDVRALTILGGSTELIKSVIASRILEEK